MKKIMFVCSGNTCRSPMAEYLLKDLLKKAENTDIKVTSAGLNACETDSINKKASGALKSVGITVRRFKPKRATEELVRELVRNDARRGEFMIMSDDEDEERFV